MASSRRKWYGLALLLLVQFMVVLDIAIVNVALPSIKLDLGFSQENLQWVISAYALFFGGFLLLGGRAADLLGRRRMFLVGVVLFTSGLVTLVYAITQANHFGWGSATTIGLFVAAGALIAAFLGWEARAKDPLMPFSIFRLRTLVGANIAGFILGTALFGMFLMLTLYMQQVLGYSPLKTGIAYLAVAGTAIVWSAIAAQLVNR